MDLDEYQEASGATDVLPGGLDGTRLALLGLVGEAGSAAAAAKKAHRDRPLRPLRDVLHDELGDMLWYAAAVARRQGLSLGDVARGNLSKSGDLFGPPKLPDLFDDDLPEAEQLPRSLRIRFTTAVDDDGVTRCRMVAMDETIRELTRQRWAEWGRSPDVDGQMGDPIDDNAEVTDHYRYHDAIHLGHAAILGWSPVLRSLLGRKRRTNHDLDRIQDGARAIATEEGLAAIVFRQLEQSGFAADDAVPFELLSQVRWSVRGHEVADVAPSAWRATYENCARVLRHLIDNDGGTVIADLNRRELRVES